MSAEPPILTPDRRLRVFVSSTLDLVEERAAVRGAVEGLRLTPVLFEAGARPHPPRALYQAYVAQSDVVVAVYAQRYGWIAPGMTVSGLEDEFELSTGKPRLVYLRADVEREPRLEALLDRVRESGLAYRRFTSAAELHDLVRDDLTVLLTERFHAADDRRPSRPAARAVLPVPPTTIIGRRPEVEQVQRWLVRDDVRLVTLVGPGGVGKTRLAVEVARAATSDFAGGVFFVSLAALREPALLGDAIAAALEVTTGDATNAVDALAGVIGSQTTLLVLDNLEQVVAGADSVARLLERCDGLRVLATSRAALRLRAERQLVVAPLDVPPDTGAATDPREAASVRLFVRAAQAVRPDLALDARTAETVATVCRELDGLPLAIELAAAMLTVLTPEQLLERVRTGLPVDMAPRDAPERHRRLSDTIAWSYELLDPTAQEAFAQLGVFRGGFTLESAAAVCDVDADLLPVVAALVEQSLVTTEVRPEHGVRFSMLTTIRHYAAARLAEDARRDAVAARHAAAFLELADGVGRPDGRAPANLDRLEVEIDNVRGAFDWALAHDGVERVANAVWESWWFWWMRGHLAEGARWADRCLADSDLGPEARARVLTARALLAVWAGSYDLAVPAFAEAAQIARAHDDDRTAAYADVAQGVVQALTADVSGGLAMIHAGTAAFERRHDELGATTGLAAACWVQGITREFHDGDEQLAQALQRARAVGSDVDAGLVEGAMAQLAIVRGDLGGAIDPAAASLEHLVAARHLASTILALEVVAELGVAAGVPGTPLRILTATDAIRSGLGTRVPPQAAARLQRLTAAARSASDDEAGDRTARSVELGLVGAVEQGRQLLDQLRAPAGARG